MKFKILKLVEKESIKESVVRRVTKGVLKESEEEIMQLVKNSIVDGKLPDEIKYKGKTYKSFNVMNGDTTGETSDIYYCNMDNTPNGDPQESNDYFFIKVALNKVNNGYKGVKEIKWVEDLTEECKLKESVVRRVTGSKLTDCTKNVINRNGSVELNENTEKKNIKADKNFIKGLIDSGALDDLEELKKDKSLYNDAIEYWVNHYFDDATEAEIKDAIDNNTAILTEDSYIRINDGKEDTDYLVQDVTELEQVEDDTVESPSIEGLLSLVNESLSNKYGNTWGYIKSKSTSIKEGMQYAIIDIVTPKILEEAKKNKIRDNAVSKTIILESVPNSTSSVNLKVNTLAGNTRFSQKTKEPAKVLTRWLESEYLYDEMVKDFQDKLLARQNTLKDSIESYLKQHPDLKVRINVIKAQEKTLKDAGMLDDNKQELSRLAYGIATEFPANIKVDGNKDNDYEMEFDTIDEIVKILFGEEYVLEAPKEDKELAKKNKKVLKDNLKESYEAFNIGEIEVAFNPETGETMYSIPSKEITDKKISLDKIPSVDTPYDTDTIIKNYIETHYGTIDDKFGDKEDKDNTETEFDVDDKEVLKEPDGDEVEVDFDADVEEREPIEKSDDIENQEEDIDINLEDEAMEENAQSETGTSSFYKIRQRDPINLEQLLNRTSERDNTEESEYIVTKNIKLSEEEFNDLISNLSKPQGFLKDLEPIDRKNYAFNVVKVTGENSPYTLLIDSVGYQYPRYVSVKQ